MPDSVECTHINNAHLDSYFWSDSISYLINLSLFSNTVSELSKAFAEMQPILTKIQDTF